MQPHSIPTLDIGELFRYHAAIWSIRRSYLREHDTRADRS